MNSHNLFNYNWLGYVSAQAKVFRSFESLLDFFIWMRWYTWLLCIQLEIWYLVVGFRGVLLLLTFLLLSGLGLVLGTLGWQSHITASLVMVIALAWLLRLMSIKIMKILLFASSANICFLELSPIVYRHLPCFLMLAFIPNWYYAAPANLIFIFSFPL